jgi:SAM-dependent methyltransferase
MKPKGRIDQVADLASLDLLQFNDGVNPFVGHDFLKRGFLGGHEYHRKYVKSMRCEGRDAVADIGCGYGRWAMFLAEVNGRVVGFDRNETALTLCRRLAAYFDLDNASFLAGDISKQLDAAAGSFDAVWCHSTLQQIDRGKFFAEARRLLRPGGTLHVGGYNGMARVWQKFFEGYKAGGLSYHTAQYALRSLRNGPFHDGQANYCDPHVLDEVLSRQGFALDHASIGIEFEEPSPFVVPWRVAKMMDDPAGLAARLAADEALATEFSRYPILATQTSALNVCFVAEKS